MDQLNKNGFLVLKNVLNMNRVNYAKELINNKVNYFRLKDFLDNDMINTVNNVLNLNIDLFSFEYYQRSLSQSVHKLLPFDLGL